MDKLVSDDLMDHLKAETDTGSLNFLLEEGLDLLANYAKIPDDGVRRALLGLVEAVAKTNR